MEEKINRSELCKAAYEGMEALYKQWGDVRTPYGHVWRVKLTYGWSNYPDKGIVIKWDDKHYSQDSTNGILHLIDQTLPAMANYLASKDFREKVKGSIKRLKAITKALQGK